LVTLKEATMKRTTADVWQDGLISGGIGYALISVYFAVSNLVVGLPALDTVESLGAALFGGTNPGQMIAYNGLHLSVFLVLGLIAAVLIHEVELHPALWYLLFFVALAGFIFSYLFMAVVASRIAHLDAYTVAVGNLVAASGTALFLFLRHPGMLRAVRTYSQGEDGEHPAI
jgi:hypothetical protein